jgi:hypothetical protein
MTGPILRQRKEIIWNAPPYISLAVSIPPPPHFTILPSIRLAIMSVRMLAVRFGLVRYVTWELRKGGVRLERHCTSFCRLSTSAAVTCSSELRSEVRFIFFRRS